MQQNYAWHTNNYVYVIGINKDLEFFSINYAL
jgi:hypothetical protein